jgi:hypothetical protein
MINAPSFAHTNGTMSTFSMKCHNDPRMTYWHVDRYVRNIWKGAYMLSLPFGGSINGFSIYAQIDTISKMECPTFGYMSFIQSNAYSLSRKWFTNLKGGEWLRTGDGPKQTICPNLSLTRYDWRPTGQRKFAKMGGHWFYTTRIPDPWSFAGLFSVDKTLFECGTYEPSIITRTRAHTRERFHGPSYELYNGRNIK